MSDDLLKNDKFEFFVPAAIVKAEKGSKKDEKRYISGICSTEDRDLQGEIVVQKGLDFSYFIRSGFINNNHLTGPENLVGQPLEAKITSEGMWMKGYLFSNHPVADHWWMLLNSMEASGSNRKIGFSIQGKVQRREGNKITKCWVSEVAITHQPVCQNTFVDIAKSLAAQEWDTNKSFNCGVCNKPECSGCDIKAMTTASAGALVPESLEGNKNPQIYKSFDEVPDGMQLSYEQVVQVLQLEKGYSRATAQCVADVAFLQKGIR